MRAVGERQFENVLKKARGSKYETDASMRGSLKEPVHRAS